MFWSAWIGEVDVMLRFHDSSLDQARLAQTSDGFVQNVLKVHGSDYYVSEGLEP